jgi:hypothetical protein
MFYGCPTKFGMEGQILRIFTIHRITTVLKMRMNVLNVQQWEKIFMWVGQTSNGFWQKGVGDGEEDVWTGDYRSWIEAAQNEERIGK